MDIKEIDILGDSIQTHWYYASKAKAALSLLKDKKGQRILDVGAGSGFFSKYLVQHMHAQEVYCVDTGYPYDYQETYLGRSIYYKQFLGHSNADIVLLLDVLEHVDNDVALLSEYVEKTPQNAYFLISVPAFSFLWSEHDVFLEHKRRYSLSMLEKCVQASGLEIEKSCYFFGAIFPLVATIRMARQLFSKHVKTIEPKSQLKQSHPLINKFLKIALHCEVPFMPYNKLAGVTVFCLARKK